MNKKFVFIGKLAKETKKKISTLKYYSGLGLLPYFQFAKNKNRVYDLEETHKKIKEIKKLKTAGYTIEMIKKEISSRHFFRKSGQKSPARIPSSTCPPKPWRRRGKSASAP